MIHKEIQNKIKEAMKAKDGIGLNTYRSVLSAFTNELVAKGKKPNEMLADEEAVAVITRLAKQRKDSIEQFAKGGRQDLVDEETAQLKILETYLPQMMERTEIEEIAQSKKAELGVDDASKKGLLMSALMKELKGKADGAEVKAVVDSLFN